MSGPDEIDARIDALEARLTHQDLALEDLNGALTRQWQQIDRLTRQVALLAERLAEMGAGAGATSPADGPPPHY